MEEVLCAGSPGRYHQVKFHSNCSTENLISHPGLAPMERRIKHTVGSLEVSMYTGRGLGKTCV